MNGVQDVTAAHRVRGSCGALSGWGRSSQSQDSPPPRVVRLSLPHPHRSDLPPSFRPHPLRSRPLPLSSVLSQGCRILRPWPSTPGSAETIFGFCICFVDLFSLFCFRFSNWAAVEASGRRKDAHWECGWLPKVMGGRLSGVDLSTQHRHSLPPGELQDAGSSNLLFAQKTTSQRPPVPPPAPLSPPTFQTARPLSPSQAQPIFASTIWMLLTKFPILAFPQDTATHPGLFWSAKAIESLRTLH